MKSHKTQLPEQRSLFEEHTCENTGVRIPITPEIPKKSSVKLGKGNENKNNQYNNGPFPSETGYMKRREFVVEQHIKEKYPQSRHQPAVLPNYRQIVDVVVKEGDKEYWLGIDYHKNEIVEGDLDKKNPEKWREAVKDYIQHLTFPEKHND